MAGREGDLSTVGEDRSAPAHWGIPPNSDPGQEDTVPSKEAEDEPGALATVQVGSEGSETMRARGPGCAGCPVARTGCSTWREALSRVLGGTKSSLQSLP